MSTQMLTPEQILSLSPEQVFAELGRRFLLQHVANAAGVTSQIGTPVAIKQPMRTCAPNTLLTCPHCDRSGPAERDFGFRLTRSGLLKPQSWCRSCRSSPDSHPTRAGRR